MYDIEYLFGFKEMIDVNIVSMVNSNKAINYFQTVWVRFNDMLEFRDRHASIMTYKSMVEFMMCEKYVITYGFTFFNNFDYVNLSNDCNIWIIYLFDYIYQKLSDRLKEKLIKIIEINMYKNINVNSDIVISFITHPIFFDKYIAHCRNHSTGILETSTLLGKLLSPLEGNVEGKHPNKLIIQKESIEKSSIMFHSLYKTNPEKIIDFFYYILEQNQPKTRVQEQCYYSDSINTYSFLLNVMMVIQYILDNTSDYDSCREPIHLNSQSTNENVSNETKLYWLVFEYYRITFYSLLQQNVNAAVQSSINPLLINSNKIYIEANNKYLFNLVYYECVFNYMLDLLSSDVFEQINEDTISEILFYWDNIVEMRQSQLSIVCKKTIYRSISNIILNKQIHNPFITIKLIKIVYLLENFCGIKPNDVLLEKTQEFYDKLVSIFIYIDKLVGLDEFTEKFFYKTNILEIIANNQSFTITNKQFIVILFHDIERTSGYLITSSNGLVQLSANNKAVYDKFKKTCLSYLTRLNLRIRLLNVIIMDKNTLLNETDIQYHLIKYYYGILKNCFDENSKHIKFFVNSDPDKYEKKELWNLFLEHLIIPFSQTIETVLHIDNIIEMLNHFYGDIKKYIELMDKELYTDFLGILRCLSDEIEWPDDLPEQFLDPILFVPIKNPMILPESKIMIEKAVIEAHLIENHYDPFNRQQLTYETLVEFNKQEEQLKCCIEFIQKRNDWIKSNHCQKCSD
jgi:hypothetical protein